jgi:endonuclease YncB( thermonuclease family)
MPGMDDYFKQYGFLDDDEGLDPQLGGTSAHLWQQIRSQSPEIANWKPGPKEDDYNIRAGRTIDADTIRTTTGGTVRFKGLDAPETAHPYQPFDPMGQVAKEFTQGLLPEGQSIALDVDPEVHDARGRLLAFVDRIDQQGKRTPVNREVLRQGLAQLTTFPNERKAEFIDAIEQAIIGELGIFSLKAHYDQTESLSDLDARMVKDGFGALIDPNTGEPTNPAFAEGFENRRRARAFGSLTDQLQEASDILNQLRTEQLVEGDFDPNAGQAAIEERLGLERGDPGLRNPLELAISSVARNVQGGPPLTPEQMAPELDIKKRDFRFDLEQGKVVDVAGGPIAEDEPGMLEKLAQAKLEGDPAIQTLEKLLGMDAGQAGAKFVDEFLAKSTKLGDVFGRTFKELADIPPRNDLVERLDATRGLIPEEQLSGTFIEGAAGLAGEIAPEVLLTLAGPGQSIVRIGGTGLARLAVLSGTNALEEAGLRAAMSDDPDTRVQEALIGGAFGAVFGGAFVGAEKLLRFSPDNLALFREHPEFTLKLMDKVEETNPRIRQVWEQFDEVDSPVFKQDNQLRDLVGDDITSQFDQADVYSDVVIDNAVRAAGDVPVSHRRRVQQENIVEASRHLIDEGDYLGAYRVVHKAGAHGRFPKDQVEQVKTALRKIARENEGVEVERAMLEMDAVNSDLAGEAITSFEDVLNDPDMYQRAVGLLSDESGRLTIPGGGVGLEDLPENLRLAYLRHLDKKNPFTKSIRQVTQTARHNLNRLEQIGEYPQAGRVRDFIEASKEAEEIAQSEMSTRLLQATVDVRPKSSYLLRGGGGGHYGNEVRRLAGTSKERAWMARQQPFWDAIDKAQTVGDVDAYLRNAPSEFQEMWRLIGGGADPDSLIITQGTNKTRATLEELKSHLAGSKLSSANNDIVDAIGSFYMERATKMAHDQWNRPAIKALQSLQTEMINKGASSADVQFLHALEQALRHPGSYSAKLASLRSLVAISRLPMVALANLPQIGQTLTRTRVRIGARALWRTHAPTWAGGARQRVRTQALFDGSAADAMIQEHLELMAGAIGNLPQALLKKLGLRASWAEQAGAAMTDFSKTVVGRVYGLKPMERWLRTVSSEAGRIYGSEMALRAARLARDPQGAELLKVAFDMQDNLIKTGTKGFTFGARHQRTMQLVKDIRDLTDATFDDVVALAKMSDNDILRNTNRYFDGTIDNTLKPGDVPDSIQQFMNMAGAKTSEATQFRVGLLDLPVEFNAPTSGRDWIRTVMQFQTFNIKQYDTFVRRYMIDAAKQGNFIPIMRVLAVALPFSQLTGYPLRAFKDMVNGSTDPDQENFINATIDLTFGHIDRDEFDERMKAIGQPKLILRNVLWDNFQQTWGGVGIPGAIIDNAMRGPKGQMSTVAGAGPSSLVSGGVKAAVAVSDAWGGNYDKAASQAFGSFADMVGNPFGITKTFERRIKERYGLGRELESFEPTVLERALFRGREDARAREAYLEAGSH